MPHEPGSESAANVGHHDAHELIVCCCPSATAAQAYLLADACCALLCFAESMLAARKLPLPPKAE